MFFSYTTVRYECSSHIWSSAEGSESNSALYISSIIGFQSRTRAFINQFVTWINQGYIRNNQEKSVKSSSHGFREVRILLAALTWLIYLHRKPTWFLVKPVCDASISFSASLGYLRQWSSTVSNDKLWHCVFSKYVGKFGKRTDGESAQTAKLEG